MNEKIKNLRILNVSTTKEALFFNKILVYGILSDEHNFLHQTTSFDEFQSMVEETDYDLFIFDTVIEDKTAIDLINHLHTQEINAPVIVFSEGNNEETAVTYMKAGVSDYLLKHTLSSDILENSIRYSLEIQKRNKSLEKEKEIAQRYLNIVNVMIVAINRDLKVSLINKKGCDILGYSEEEVIGKNWFDHFIPEALREEVKAVFHQFMAGAMILPQYYENPIINKNGEERVIAWHNTIVRNDEGKIISCLSSGDDITEKISVQKALAESEKKYRDLIENTQDLFYRTDMEGRIVFISPSVKRLSGFTVEEAMGMKMADEVYAHPEERENLINTLKAQGSIENFPAWLRRKDGTLWLGSANAHFYKDESGQVLGVEGIVRDITPLQDRTP